MWRLGYPDTSIIAYKFHVDSGARESVRDRNAPSMLSGVLVVLTILPPSESDLEISHHHQTP